MLETLKATLKRQSGFSLVELVVVMAIIATLAGVVLVSITGTGESSKIATAQQDARIFGTSASNYFADQRGKETLTTSAVTVVALFNDETEADIVDVEQSITDRWPETFITEELASLGDIPFAPYANELPTFNAQSSGLVVKVNIRGLDQPNGDPGFEISRVELLGQYTAVDFDLLVDGGYAEKPSVTFNEISRVEGVYFRSYLWLFRKTTSSGGSGANDSRVIALFRLISIDGSDSGALTLNFKQID